MDELKPCPFCGDECETRSTFDGWSMTPAFSAGCPECGIYTYPIFKKREAIERWNRRAGEGE